MKTQRQIWSAAVLSVALAVGLLLGFSREGKVAGSSSASEEGATARESVAGKRELTFPVEAARPAPSPAANPETRTRLGAFEKERPELPPDEQIATLLGQHRDLSHPDALAELVAELRRLEDRQAEHTKAKAEELGLPLLTRHGSLLTGFAGEVPLYEISHNAEAAKSIGTDQVREMAPYFPDGKDHQVGLWDVYYGAATWHDEIANVNLKDEAVPGGLHASHVAGTLIGFGYDPRAKGMAPQAEVWSFSSSNVLSEIAAHSAQNATDFGKLFVSVHPYGVASGWEYDGTEWYGNFSSDGDNRNDVPSYLGQYGSSTSSWDGTARSFPFHLLVKSAGNHNDDNAPAAGTTWWLNGQSGFDYDPASHPKSDGDHYALPGYGTIDARASAKNVLTVGSVSDAVTAGARDPGAAVLSEFSSTGPTDDGRIKPDLVGNGEGVFSVDGSTSDQYLTASGTSMASASVAGSAQLLQEIYRDQKGKMMRASTLKGLLIHTADDLELPGPDYRTGWGLANVQAAAQLLYDHEAAAPLDRLKQAAVKADDPMDYYVVAVDGSGPVRVTLCWTDQAGQWTSSHDSRTPRLVNDLNVRLVSLDGTTTHYPYVMPFTATWAESDLATPAVTGVNTVDNVEQIHVEAPAPGLYRVEVDYAGSLQGTRQRYSLLVSGTYLDGEGVEVVNPVADQSFMVADPTPIVVANGDAVFSGSGHAYEVSWTPEGILTASVDAAGDVQVVPTLANFGRVELTLTATDLTGATAQTSFSVALMSNILRVDADTLADPAQQDGSSWSTAFGKVQDALEIAVAGQEIWIADGVYYPDERNAGDSNDQNESFVLPDQVAIYGGFTATESTRAERNPDSQGTILSGDLWQDDAQQPIASLLASNSGDWNNCYRVVRVPGGSFAILDGVVVTAGKNTDFLQPDGAGILVETDATLLLANCLITGNECNGNGGGVANLGGYTGLAKCTLVGNKAGAGGGALSSEFAETGLSHCEIRGNQASDGGAIYLLGEVLGITDCLFSGNAGFFGAGGIHAASGWFAMTNCTMTGHSSYGQGGAIAVVGALSAPLIQNTIIWKNMAGGSQFGPGASVYGMNFLVRPWFENCLVANSGGSANWNSELGWDGGNNIHADPGFVAGIEPGSAPTDTGDFALTVNSPAQNAGNTNLLGPDLADLDGDGNLAEPVPFDLAGNERVVSVAVDMGAYEFADLDLIDGDGDGLSDAFEEAHGGNVDPMSDDDGDGMTALAEFVHGLDPNAPLEEPVGNYDPMEYLGTQYLCMKYLVNPDALNFVNITVERRGALNSPLGWLENQTIVMSTVQSLTHPGMLEVTVRSLVPFGQDGMEFLRIRHDIIPSGEQTIPQSDPIGSTSVSGVNVWGGP